jgi:hypothetical protein
MEGIAVALRLGFRAKIIQAGSVVFQCPDMLRSFAAAFRQLAKVFFCLCGVRLDAINIAKPFFGKSGSFPFKRSSFSIMGTRFFLQHPFLDLTSTIRGPGHDTAAFPVIPLDNIRQSFLVGGEKY